MKNNKFKLMKIKIKKLKPLKKMDLSKKQNILL